MRRILALLSLLLGIAGTALAAPHTVQTEQATLSLVAEHPAYTPGRPLQVGLSFDLIPHWHVYWRNPGDSGEAPRVTWTLPAGWHAGPLQWPVPQRIAVGPFVNYGYERHTLLRSELLPPADFRSAATLKADVSWLVCREECIPQQARLELSLAAATGATTADPRFAAARTAAALPLPGNAVYRLGDTGMRLALSGTDWKPAPDTQIWFAADQWGPVAPSLPQRWTLRDERLELDLPFGDAPPAAGETLSGLLVVSEAGADGTLTRGFELQAQPASGPLAESRVGLAAALLLAFAGGLLLNLMPCVLPVLSIKVLGLVGQRGGHAGRHGVAYAAGVVATFLALAALLAALRAGGAMLGWGFQLQEPLIVVALLYLMLGLAMNLSGVFEMGGGLSGLGQSLTERRGVRGSFATGALAVVVASPCTAPFMGTALGFALTRPTAETLLVFAALAAGFALPMLLLSLFPAWLQRLPAPGPWMERLRRLLAFPLYATAAWLLWVLSQQVAAEALAATLAGAVLLAFGLWWFGQAWQRPLLRRLPVLALLAGSVVCAGYAADLHRRGAEAAPTTATSETWQPQRVAQLRAEGRAVLVNFTAAWCITCKVNERVALRASAVRDAMAANDIAYLTADWTRRDAEITKTLQAYGRSGVPLYLLYPPDGGEPQVLPQLLTAGIVLDAFANLNHPE
ncbi:MAG: thioredoxin family protein [Gammaproteobacteria bacterium]|nr:thioredoxin family protein [Gammaproteobacteria bacterium]